MHYYSKRKASGVVLPIVGLILAVLLGMAGLVIDLGGLFVAKTELQSAADSCALAAAQELNGATDAIDRAVSAGQTAGIANKVQYQKVAVSFSAADITFSDTLAGTFSSTFSPAANARYAKCGHTTSGIVAYLIQLVGGASSNAVAATAVATRVHAQSACPIPVGLVPKSGFDKSPPDYGFKQGDWVTMLNNGGGNQGEMGWYNLDGSTSASETANEMSGHCGSKYGDTLGTPGVQASVYDWWNGRFGIYKNNNTMKTTNRPDTTGFTYTSNNWSGSAYNDFLAQRLANSGYQGDTNTGLNTNPGGYNTYASKTDFQTYGLNKRIVVVPVVSNSTKKILDFACMLMLQPIMPSTTSVQFEYLGNSSNVNSPCLAFGLAGGSYGPLVPVLVQ